jgi:hypothetical protein
MTTFPVVVTVAVVASAVGGAAESFTQWKKQGLPAVPGLVSDIAVV